MRRTTPVATIILALVCLGPSARCEPRATQAYGEWIATPHAEWPHIALINRIDYEDASHPVAGCGFLLETDDGIVAATAKHVLRYFKSGRMDSVSFGGSLESWSMSPKDDPSRTVVVGELINEDDDEPLEAGPGAEDWLLFAVAKNAEGVQPLRLRRTPLEEGETVFIVGWRYSDEGTQKVYEGTVLRTEDGTLLVSTDALADNKIPGLSGAPVIDARGYVIGLMSSKAGELERLSSVDYPRRVLATRCAREMTERYERRGWVGIAPEVDSPGGAYRVAEVYPESPAAKAGIRVHDILRGLDGVEVDDGRLDALERTLSSFRPGRTVLFEVERDGKRLEIAVRIETIPEVVLEQWIEQHRLEHH